MHDRTNRVSVQSDQIRSGTSRAQSIAGRGGLAGKPGDLEEVGAGEKAASHEGGQSPLGHPVSGKPQFFVFDAGAGKGVRIIETPEHPWFVAADVCRLLEIAEPHRAIAMLEADEKGRHSMTTLGGPQQMAVINESGLYALIFKSRKPAARAFRKWVTNEVLPSIRKTGGYRLDPAQLVREYSVVQLPPAPPLDAAVGRLVGAALQLAGGQNFMTRSGFVHPHHLAEACLAIGDFGTMCESASNRPQVAQLMRFLTAYTRRWLPIGERQEEWVWFEPSPKSYRRYWVSKCSQNKMPTEIERAPWSPRWEPDDALPPSRRLKEVTA